MKIQRLGFSGTRDGMTINQYATVEKLLTLSTVEEVHHGDCVGSDEQFHSICLGLGLRIITHPPIKDQYRAFCIGEENREPKDYLLRDKDIVDETEALMATPKQESMAVRSGTWYTIRYAATCRRHMLVINPNGSLNMQYL